MEPGQRYAIKLYGGTCQTLSASFTQIAEVDMDQNGKGNKNGELLYRGQEKMSFDQLTQGEHALVVVGANTNACTNIHIK
jgi:hypothetical protein